MPRHLRNGLAVLLRHIRWSFGRESSGETTSKDDGQEWSFEPVKNLYAPQLDVPVKLANGQAQTKPAQRDKRRELVVAMAALLGVINRQTLDWIVTKMFASSDPPMHLLARGLKAMWNPDKRGRASALDRDLQLACLVHVEVVTLRASGMEEDNIRDRAADIVLDGLEGLSPETGPQMRTRLMEIYRDNEARVQEIWLEMEATGLTHPST